MKLALLLALALAAACSKDPAAAGSAPSTASPGSAPAAAAAQPATTAARPQPARTAAVHPAPPAPELTLASFKGFTRRRSADVRRCYEAALAGDASLRGKLTLSFAILPGGGVSDVRVVRSTLPRSSAVPSCVASVVRGWKTPFRPAEPVEVEYPIDLRPR